MNVSARLVEYWRTTLPLSRDLRRRALSDASARVGSGATPPSELLAFSLGDTDTGIVFDATLAYLDAAIGAGARASDVAGSAIEWIRRSLALNRSAVFAALLSTGDERVTELLTPMRRLLLDCEFASIRKCVGMDQRMPIQRFLLDWAELHESDSTETSAASGRQRIKAPEGDGAPESARSRRAPAPVSSFWTASDPRPAV